MRGRDTRLVASSSERCAVDVIESRGEGDRPRAMQERNAAPRQAHRTPNIGQRQLRSRPLHMGRSGSGRFAAGGRVL